MREMIHLSHIAVDDMNGNELIDYNLVLFEGQVVTVFDRTGIEAGALLELLKGNCPAFQGDFRFDGKRIQTKKEYFTAVRKIFVLNTENYLVETMSVLDNLIDVSPVKNVFSIYRSDLVKEKVERVLTNLDFTENLDTPVWKLSFWNKQKVCICKALLAGITVLLIDCRASYYNENNYLELKKIARELCERGISVLVLSSEINLLTDSSDSFQILQKGMDLMNWYKDECRNRSAAEYQAMLGNIRRQDKEMQNLKGNRITCLFCRDWGMDPLKKLHWLLEEQKTENPLFLAEYLDIRWNEHGQMYNGETVEIPADINLQVFENMSVLENLTLCIRRKMTKGPVIVASRESFLLRDFAELTGLELTEKTMLWELDQTGRRIVAIHRWVLLFPKALVLCDPFSTLSVEEEVRMKEYLEYVERQGISLFIMEKSLDVDRELYSTIIELSEYANPLVYMN